MLVFWIIQLWLICFVRCETVETLCTSESIPSSQSGGATTTTTGKSFLMQDETFIFTCCGVVNQWNVNTKAAGTITMQIWRHQGSSSFELVSQQDYTVTSGSNTISAEDHEKVSFRTGDMIGWYSATAGLVKYTSSSVQNNRYVSTQAAATVGGTYDWNTAEVIGGATYSIQAITSATSDPYFINLPWYTQLADTAVTSGGIDLLTLSANDPDLADNSSLTISMAPEWVDYFSLSTSNMVTTSRQLTPGSYLPVFRVEEAHCGVGFSATLTVSVTDSAPSITNLPASTTIHEDSIDQTLLYTVSTTDPMNQPIWCEGDWTIGVPSNIPFIVKMTSMVPGSSTAGIYLIEWPFLNYDSSATTYELVVKCYDTYSNSATGTYSVNIQRNQEPIFANMGNMVEINSTTAKIGDTVFRVSANDADGDQILYDYTCAPATTTDGACPFAVYDTGDVKLKANVLTWDTNKFTLTITASANNDTITGRDLIIYITNQNNLPVITNVNGVTKTVAENSALSTSILQVTSTDADSDSITYFYDITPEAGYQLFECTSSGLVRTHSTYTIDFDVLATATYSMIIYAHDTKEWASETLTITVTNVNEALTFLQPSYGITMDENSGSGVPTYIAVDDLDQSDTVTYAMNCGTYDSYFSLSAATIVTFLQTYDLDTGLLPDEVVCAVYATDSGGLNDTATLFIRIAYVNDNSPVFAGGTSYTVNLGTDTPVGYFIVSAVATDADRESDTIVNYSIDQSGLTGATVHIQSGLVYAKTNFSAVSVGSYTIQVIATDGTNSVTAVVTLVVSLVTTPDADTTNRDYNFFDDTRNIMWFAATCIAVLGLLFVVTVLVISYCRSRKTPLLVSWWRSIKKCFTFERKPVHKHQLDRRRRKKPIYGRQHSPTYKHLHAHQLLRASPEVAATPDPIYDTEENSSITPIGKIRVSRVNLRANSQDDEVNKWLNESQIGTATASGESSGARPKSSDKEEPAKRRSRQSRISPSTPLPVSPSVILPQPATADPTIWNGGDNGTYMDDDDDFRSERISIAASRNTNVDDF